MYKLFLSPFQIGSNPRLILHNQLALIKLEIRLRYPVNNIIVQDNARKREGSQEDLRTKIALTHLTDRDGEIAENFTLFAKMKRT